MDRSRADWAGSVCLGRVPVVASVTGVVVGIAVLVGWSLDLSVVKSVAPGLPAITPTGALGLALAGAGLGLLSRRPVSAFRRFLALACSGSVLFLGLVTLVEHAIDWDSGIDGVLFPEATEAAQGSAAGRPAVQTALALFLLGLGLGLLDFTPRGLQLSHMLVLLAVVVALLALIGYACNVPTFYGMPPNYPGVGLALHLAFVLVLLGTGVLCARPERGLTAVLVSPGPGGWVARRLLLAPVVVPLVIGWIRLAAQRGGLIRPEFGGWIFALSNIVVFTLIIWWSAQFLYRMDAARSAAETKFRAVAETAGEAIVTADGQGRVIYFNPAAEKMFGYPLAEVAGRPLTILMPERFRSQHLGGLTRFLLTGESNIIGSTVEVVARHKTGNEFPVELSLAHWQVGRDHFFTGILRDIRERKEAEDAVRHANLQLAGANRELEAFSDSVSHDLRAPLRSIDGFSRALEEDYGERLDSPARNYLGRIRAATQRMGQLIDDLLNLARVSRKPLHPEPVNLTDLARSIAGELQNSDPDRAVTFDIADGMQATGDPRLLRVALENLLTNAWKYTSKHPSARIEVGLTAGSNGTATFFVRDDGAGFDMAYAHKLFAPFQRLHAAADFPGTGIGLATVQRILHRHGGRIWAEAAVEKGATFFFTLDH